MSWLWEGRGNREEAGVAGTGRGLLRVGALSSSGDLWREEDFEFFLPLWGEFKGVGSPEVRHRQMNPAPTGEQPLGPKSPFSVGDDFDCPIGGFYGDHRQPESLSVRLKDLTGDVSHWAEIHVELVCLLVKDRVPVAVCFLGRTGRKEVRWGETGSCTE